MSLTIRLLGKPEISLDNKPVRLKGQKALALLAYLLIVGKMVTRQHLVDLLHDEAADPRASLRWILSQLRRAIGVDYLEVDRHQIGFNFDSDYWFDVETLLAGEDESYRGDFLEGVYLRDAQSFMDWTFFERERLRETYQRILSDQLDESQSRGDYQAVVDLAQRLLLVDNLREEWHRALIRAYALLGNREAALAQYSLCSKVLRDEFDVSPELETEALLEQIKADTLADPRSLADLPVQFPAFLQTETGFNVNRRPAFVARERELARLEQLLSEAMTGHGQVAFVIGEAGRGKSALLDEFSRRAQLAFSDLLVASGQCDAYAGIGDPHLPFREVMAMLTGDVEARVAAGTISRDHARRLWANLMRSCQALFDHGPNLIDILISRQALLARVQTAVPGGGSGLVQLHQLVEQREPEAADLTHEYLFQQVTNVLQILAAKQPLLLVLDDLQWADASSISLLFHLGRRLDHHRILVVGAYRPAEVALGRGSKRHPLANVLNEFKRIFGDVWIDLGQTAPGDDFRLVETLLDVEPNHLGPEFRQALYRHTEGHPLFTIELIREMLERGDLVQNEQGQWIESVSLNWDVLPSRVEAVIEERVNRLEGDLRQALTIASVEGEEFTAQVTAQVQGINERRWLGTLSQTLSKKHRLVRERGEVRLPKQTLSRYRFSHALFQRYLYNECSPGERRLLHGEVGTALEGLYGDRAGEIAGLLARHFLEANMPEKAHSYLCQAGEQAVRQYANEEAILYFSRALETLPTSALSEQYHMLLAREKVYDLQGDRERQQRDITALLELADKLEDDQKRAEALLRQAHYSAVTDDYPATTKAAWAAINLAESIGSITLEAEGYLNLGYVRWRQGDYPAAQSQLQRALSLTIHLPRLHGRSLRRLGLVFWHQGDFPTARKYFEMTLLIFEEIGDQQGQAGVLNNLGIIAAEQGNPDQARSFFERSLMLCRQVGVRKLEGDVLNNLGIIEDRSSDYLAAGGYYEQALAIKREIDDRQGVAMVLDNLGNAARYQHDYTRARAFFEESLRIRQKLGERLGEANVLNNLGNVAHYLGDYPIARRYYEQSLTLRQDIGDRQGQGETLSYLSLLFHHLGENEVAFEYGERALQIVEALGDHHLQGHALTHLGHALAGQQRLAEATERYQRAVEMRKELGEHHRAMEPIAGLARIGLWQGKLEQATVLVEEILGHLDRSTLDGTEEPARVYLTCYHVLQAIGDSRSEVILNKAHALLQEQAAKISDAPLRAPFLENVATHRELVEEFQKKTR